MDVRVSDNSERHRFEVAVDGQPAGFASYVTRGDVVEIPHTEVDPAHGGQGIGGQLVRGSLDILRAHGKKVEPSCPFVDAWMRKHPDYEDLRA